MTRLNFCAVPRAFFRRHTILLRALFISLSLVGPQFLLVVSLPLNILEPQASLDQVVRYRMPKNADEAIQNFACYFQEKEDTERVAFPFLVGLLVKGPIGGLLGACAAAKASQLCNNPIRIEKSNTTENSYYTSFRAFLSGSTNAEFIVENQSYYAYFKSFLWSQESPELKYSEDDIFGGLVGGLLIGYYMRQSLISALLSAVVTSFVATTSGFEGNLVRFLGSSVTSLIHLCRLIARRAHVLGWNQVWAEAYTYFWDVAAPYIEMLTN